MCTLKIILVFSIHFSFKLIFHKKVALLVSILVIC